VVGKRNVDEGINHISTILLGDSNAAHFVGAIGAFANHSGFQFRNIQASTCPPIKTSLKNLLSQANFLNVPNL
jgi:hypothetical protein